MPPLSILITVFSRTRVCQFPLDKAFFHVCSATKPVRKGSVLVSQSETADSTIYNTTHLKRFAGGSLAAEDFSSATAAAMSTISHL